MRSILLPLFALLIAVTSVVVDLREGVAFDFHSEKVSSSALLKDAWQTDSVVSSHERFTKDSHLIAQDFIPIVIIADIVDVTHNFAHYLPLYNLNRQKEYFLLI